MFCKLRDEKKQIDGKKERVMKSVIRGRGY